MTSGNIGYYQKFIRGYIEVTAHMEKLLKKYFKFQWNEEYQESMDVLKNKMVTTHLLIFSDWKKEFHVHVDASSVALSVVLAHIRKGSINHLISFSS